MEFRYDLVPTTTAAFDVEAIESRLAAMPEVVDHFAAQREFLFCGSVRAKEQLNRLLREGAAISYDMLGVVVVHAHRIHVHQLATEGALARMQASLIPLIEEYQCRVLVDGADRTAEYDGRWAALFGEDESGEACDHS
ncbi:MAG: hypothetical protein JNL98_00815 [Bryobacterales bacterium]|nr:hypothetical protein [Bryobacterales bacterium]